MISELSVIKTHGGFVSQQINQLSETVLINADDGIELSIADIEQVEAVDKAIEATQGLTRACLYWMREKKGWLILGFASFEDYGFKRFGYEKVYLHRLANAHEITKNLELPIGNKETPETHLRPLNKIPEKDQKTVWNEAIAAAKEEGKKLSAKYVEEAVRKYKELELKLNQQIELTEAIKITARHDAELSANEKILEAEKRVLEGQNEIKNLKNKITGYKANQTETVKWRVESKLREYDLEIERKQLEIDKYTKEADSLKQVYRDLNSSLGIIKEHDARVKGAKENLAFIWGEIEMAKEIEMLPKESRKQWLEFADALNSLAETTWDWLNKQTAINAVATVCKN